MSDTLTGREGRENLWTDANSFDKNFGYEIQI